MILDSRFRGNDELSFLAAQNVGGVESGKGRTVYEYVGIAFFFLLIQIDTAKAILSQHVQEQES